MVMIESGNPIGPSKQDELDSLVQRLRHVAVKHYQINDDPDPYETVASSQPSERVKLDAADAIESLREQVTTRDVCMQTLAKEADTWQSLRALDLAALVELGKERDALRQDAERYQWLRRFDHFAIVDEMLSTIDYNTLDEAVDAALGEGK